MPHRKWLVKNFDKEREALFNYIDDDEGFPPLQCFEPQLALFQSNWIASCLCGWEFADEDYDIVWEKRTKHINERFD